MANLSSTEQSPITGPFSKLHCGRRTHRKPKIRQRSGIGPEPALEAINLSPRAQRENPLLRASLRAQDRSRGAYASNGLMTSPAMSVRRKSRPSKRCVKRVCSMPRRCSIVACRSCTLTGSSTML